MITYHQVAKFDRNGRCQSERSITSPQQSPLGHPQHNHLLTPPQSNKNPLARDSSEALYRINFMRACLDCIQYSSEERKAMSAFLHVVEKEQLLQQFLDMRLRNLCLSDGGRQIPTQRKVKSTKVMAELENQSSGKGKWNRGEQVAYVNFLEENIEDMQTKLARKSRKVFLNMALLVRSRTADQCRSHHQKILNYHGNVQEIIRFYREDVFPFVDEMRENLKARKEEELQTKTDEYRTSGKLREDFVKVHAMGNSFKIDILCSAILEY